MLGKELLSGFSMAHLFCRRGFHSGAIRIELACCHAGYCTPAQPSYLCESGPDWHLPFGAHVLHVVPLLIQLCCVRARTTHACAWVVVCCTALNESVG